VKIWEKLVQIGPRGNVFAVQVEPAIAEARNLAGMPPASKPAGAASSASVGAIGKGTVSGTVSLSPGLASKVQPDDTVFIFARAAQGSRMPLAILRKQVKDLPYVFRLDDSMAMSPANALSGAEKIVVGARVSKSGNAVPQAGDYAGLSKPVSVGAVDVKLEIADEVKP